MILQHIPGASDIASSPTDSANTSDIASASSDALLIDMSPSRVS